MHRMIVAHILSGEAACILNELRARLDPKTNACIPAHLTLAGPFESQQPAQTYADVIADVARSFSPIHFTLRGFASFLPITCATFACVHEPSLIVNMHDYLLDKLAWTEMHSYVPHVTVTEYLNEAETRFVSDQLGQTELLVHDRVTALSLMSKDAMGIWRCVESFPLF